jgi:DNA-binding transcriptional LysR family regulator
MNKRTWISVRELDGEPVIARELGSSARRVFERVCKSARFEPDYVIETTSRETVKEAVAAGLGIGVVSEAELKADPRFWPLQVNDAELDYTEYAICLNRKKNLRLVSEFFRLADSITQSAAS